MESLVMGILLLLLFCVFLLSYIFLSPVKELKKLREKLKPIPCPPANTIVLELVAIFHLSPFEQVKKFMEVTSSHGRIVVHWLGPFPFVIISEAKYTEVFFTAKETQTKSRMYKYLEMWLGQGLLTSKGDKWRKHRKLITPAFHFSILNDFCEKFARVSEMVVEKLVEHPEGTPIDVSEIMGLAAFDGLCEAAMGAQVNAIGKSEFSYSQAVKSASIMFMERMFKPWYWNDFILRIMPYGRKVTNSLKTIFELQEKMIKEKRSTVGSRRTESIKAENNNQPQGKKKQPFLDLLLDACDSGSEFFTEQDLKDQVATFMFEGHDTTTSALSFTLFLLGLHPEIQDKCFEELHRIFGNSIRRPTVDDLKAMDYLKQVIKESLRLFPSVPLLIREVEQDVQMGEYTLPAGVTLTLNIYHLHRDPKVFPDPERFDPDRFSQENSGRRHPFAHVPFAAGLRNCIGQKFAMMEMKILLSLIIRNFELESAYGRDELSLIFGLTLRSEKRLDVRFKQRKIRRDSECTSVI